MVAELVLLTFQQKKNERLNQDCPKVRETNEPVIIGKAGKPVAILSAYQKNTSPRRMGGSWERKVKISPDFDEIDEEIIDSFYNSTLFPNES